MASRTRLVGLVLGMLLGMVGAGIGRSVAACDPSSQDYVVNGTFDGGFASWEVVPVNGSVMVVDPPPGGNNIAQLTVNEADGSDQWKVSIDQWGQAQGLDGLLPDRNYALTFKAQAFGQPHPLNITLDYYLESSTFNGVASKPLARFDIPVTLNLESYSVTFRTHPLMKPSLAPGQRRLNFFAAAGTGTLWLDDIRVTEMPEGCFTGIPLVVTQFQPGEVWQADFLAPSRVASPPGGLHLSIPANDRAWMSRILPLDLSADGSAIAWDLELKLNTDTPQNVGRMYVALQWQSGSEAEAKYFKVQRSFSGLRPGDNTLLLRHTANSLTDEFVNLNPDPAADYARIFEVGVKVEANGNGPVNMTLKSIRVLPPGGARPVSLTRINVVGVGPNSATVNWQVDRSSDCSVNYGTTTAYGSLAQGVSSPLNCSVTLNGLTPGTTYHLQAVAHDAHSVNGISSDFTLVTEPSTANAWIPGGGSGPFKVGIYGLWDAADVSEATGTGFDYLFSALPDWTCSGYPMGDDSLFQTAAEDFLSQAAAVGAKALLPGPCNIAYWPGRPPANTFDEGHVDSRVNFLKTFPALLGYATWDEPEGATADPGVLKDRLLQAYNRIHADDPNPNHRIYMATQVAGPSFFYNDVLDRAQLDHYPVPKRPADYIACSLEQARAGPKQPYDFVYQAHQGDQYVGWPGDAPGPSTRFPTLAEMRLMSYLALAHGADTVWAYAFTDLISFVRGNIYQAPEGRAGSEWQLSQLGSLARELRRLGPALTSGGAPPGMITVTSTAPCQAIDLITKSYQGFTYIVAINRKASYASDGNVNVPLCPQFPFPIVAGCTTEPCCGPAPILTTGKFKLSGGDFVGSVQVLGESRQITPNGGKFEDQFAPLGVHVYRVANRR